MDAIWCLAERLGWRVQHASPQGGPARDAYRSTIVPVAGDIWIECAPAVGGKAAITAAGGVWIDHHFPGDPGYGADPTCAVGASSIGQLADLFRTVELSPRERAIAACDHCLPAACAGIVPGISIADVAALRAASLLRPSVQLDPELGIMHEAALTSIADILTTVGALASAPTVWIGVPSVGIGAGVADLRGLPLPPDDKDGGALPGLATVASFARRPYVCRVRERGRVKVVLGGDGPGSSANGDAAAAFAAWAAAHGYIDPYGGDPERGFAGAYEREGREG
jgi:hypothetical protein